MSKQIRKVVFPIAGLGTRVLPATKAMPKEMLTIVDKPLIQYAVEEAQKAGIEEFIFVTGRGKQVIEDHFDYTLELELALSEKEKYHELDLLNSLAIEPGKLFFTRQQKPLGLGHAIWCAYRYILDEPFAVISPDDLVLAEEGCLSQMMDVYRRVGGNVVAVEDVPRNETNRYGILDIDKDDGIIVSAKGLVEKPEPHLAPSTLSIIGRYILQPQVFKFLGKHQLGAGGEIQLTDAISKTISSTPFYGLRFNGQRFDCGTKSGFVLANIAYALKRDDLKQDVCLALQNNGLL